MEEAAWSQMQIQTTESRSEGNYAPNTEISHTTTPLLSPLDVELPDLEMTVHGPNSKPTGRQWFRIGKGEDLFTVPPEFRDPVANDQTNVIGRIPLQ